MFSLFRRYYSECYFLAKRFYKPSVFLIKPIRANRDLSFPQIWRRITLRHESV